MNELKKFMRPSASGIILTSTLLIIPWLGLFAALFMNPGIPFAGGWVNVLAFLLVLAGSPFLFYATVIYEIKVWKRDIKAYERDGTFEALAAEFQSASPSFNRRRLRLGSSHIFCQGESTVLAYDDILIINVWYDKEDRVVTLTAFVKDSKFPVQFRSVKWRRSDSEIQEALSAISERNPDIEFAYLSH